MRSPWHGEQHVSREERLEHQVLLGHFIERSTSAPPVSTDQHKFNGGGTLMEDSEVLFRNSTPNHRDVGLFMGGRDSAPLTSSSFAFNGGLEDDTGRSTAPLSYAGTSLSNALLSSGLSDGPSSVARGTSRSSSSGFDYHVDHHSPRESTGLPDEPHFARSRSAAPTFLSDTPRVAPPPGLSSRSSSHLRELTGGDTYIGGDSYAQQGIRRSTSAGPSMTGYEPSSSVLASLGIGPKHGGSEAVRPAPKTLMDLIKEDSPPPYSHGDPFSGYNNNNNHSIDRHAPPPRSLPAGAIYERNDFDYEKRPTTASPLDTFANDHYENHRMDEYQQKPHAESRGYKSSGSQGHGMGGITQQMERLQVGPGGQPYVVGLPQTRIERAPGTQYLSVPVPRGVSPMNPHQEQPMFHEHSRTQPRVIYSQPHPSQHPQHSRQFDGQQVYYAPSQPLPTVVVDQPPSYTTAVLPNGQTVYLNASQFSYSAAQPVQYQAPHHQPHMIHAQHQVQGQDYMTVMPMQPGGHIAYYQGVEGNSRGPQVILNQPVTYPRGVEAAPVQGRAKEVDRGGKAATKGRRGGAGPASGRRDDPRAKQSTTSPLLDEFRTTKNRDWTMLDITGHVMEFCQDQNGSRFIQQRLEIGNASEQNVVMAEVLPAVRQLRTDVFGNYVVQKLLEFGTSDMKAQLRDTLKGEMLPLSLQMYGCRVVQKALETLDEDDLPKLLIEFHHNVLSCIHDQNGNHVIQKCIEVMSTKAKQAYSMHDGERANFFGEQIDFIINDVLDNVTSLSCHPYGCRVLQRILEHCVEPKKILALDEIAKCHKVLLDDQYGNYVIQHVLQHGRHQDRESIMHIVIANGLLPLSKQKFASNVVEKLLKYGTPAQRNLLVREMLVVVDDPNSGGSSVVLLMVRDAYANYVVQTTLDVVSEGEEKRLLLEELNAHSAQLRQYTFAKHIVTKLSS